MTHSPDSDDRDDMPEEPYDINKSDAVGILCVLFLTMLVVVGALIGLACGLIDSDPMPAEREISVMEVRR